MDFLKKQLDVIQQNLSGLNATQKMLTGALVVIMVLTMVMWARYAGSAEMEPVLNQTLSEDDMSRMSASLDARGIANKIVGGKLLVPADRKMQALAELSYQQMLPRSSKSGFDEMFEKLNAFSGPQERDAAYNRGREMTLSQIISGFPNVATADVLISDNRGAPRIGSDIKASATINIRTRGGGADKKLVNAAADLVTGAVNSLDRDRIKVVVDGLPARVQGADSIIPGGGGTLLEEVQAWETRSAHKIEKELSYFGSVRVSVTGSINIETQNVQERKVDPKATSVQPKSIETNTIESNNSTPPGGDTGVGANIGGMAITAGGQSTTSSQTTEKIQNQIDPSWKMINSIRPAGEFTAQQASVRLPRSYFEAMLKQQSGGKDPSPTEVDAAIEAILPSIRRTVTSCTNITEKDNILVDTYYEVTPLGNGPAVAGVSGGGGITGMIGGWGKELGVGLLAVVSLFMVSTMVRKSTPAPMVVQTPEVRMPSTLGAAEDLAGLATEGGPTLAGMELDDDTIQTQQILDQVQQMVGENPDAAANLVKRWLNRT
jgi:flagellar M-ring protein FliF